MHPQLAEARYRYGWHALLQQRVERCRDTREVRNETSVNVADPQKGSQLRLGGRMFELTQSLRVLLGQESLPGRMT